jgi:uncharacterized delta-60 repeat protein
MRYTSHSWRRLASAFLVVSFCTVNPVAAAVPGDPDADFGAGGTAQTDTGGDARDVAVQCDGRIVAVGGSSYTVARFNTDGSPDISFSGTGFKLIEVGGETMSGHVLVIQRDGKIVVFGRLWPTGTAVAIRLDSDGSVDSAFGSGGIANLNVSANEDALWAAALQPDGKILAAGSSGSEFLMVRLNAEGILDTSFDSDGVVTNTPGTWWGFNAITLQADGKILGVGGLSGAFMIARLNSNGSLDTSFGMDGIVTTETLDVFGTPTGVAVRSDGKIVVTGYGGITGSSDPYREVILLRFSSDGVLDTSFGSNGIVATNIAPTDDEIYDLVLDPQERILVAGQAEDFLTADPTVSVLIARYTAEGDLDDTFGTGGVMVGDASTAWAITLQTDGKIVIGGYRGEPERKLLVQRFLNDPASAGLVPDYCQASSGSNGSSGGSSGGTNTNNSGEDGGGGGGSIDVFTIAFAISLLAIGGVRRRRSR